MVNQEYQTEIATNEGMGNAPDGFDDGVSPVEVVNALLR